MAQSSQQASGKQTSGSQSGQIREGNEGGLQHSRSTAKVVEIVAASTEGFDDAVRTGLADAAKTIRHISGAEVTSWTVRCEEGRPNEYRVALKLAFGIER